MIPSNINRNHILRAIRKVDQEGIVPSRKSKKYDLRFKSKRYPPKYILSLANVFANRRELSWRDFKGGRKTNNFLSALGFSIVKKR